MIAALFYHLGAFFSRILPDGVPQRIAWAIGHANYVLRFRTRVVIAENLRIIHGDEFSERQLRQRARQVVLNFAKAIQIFLELPFLDPEEVERRTDFSEIDAAVASLGEKQPFIFASAHIGPWELGGYLLSRRGYQLHTVALEHPSKKVSRFYSDRRQLMGMHAHPVHNAFPRLKAALDGGGVVALLIDRAYGKVKKQFSLFGVESEFPLGHLVLSLRCRVPVMTVAFVFDGDRSYKWVHGGTHFPEQDPDEFARLENLQEKCLRDLEGIIRAYSDQWSYFKPLNRTETYGP